MINQEIAILLVQEGNSPKTQWPLAGDSIIIGRDASNSVQIDDRQVSRHHFTDAVNPQRRDQTAQRLTLRCVDRNQ